MAQPTADRPTKRYGKGSPEAKLRAQIGAKARWAGKTKAEKLAANAKARATYLEQLADKADPGHRLNPQERAEAAKELRRVQLLRMSLAASDARAKRRAEKAQELDRKLHNKDGAPDDAT